MRGIMLHVHRCRVSNLDGIFLDLCLRVFVFSTIIARFESDVKAKYQSSPCTTSTFSLLPCGYVKCNSVGAQPVLLIPNYRMEKKKAHQRGWVCKNARYGFSFSCSFPPLSHDLPRSPQDPSFGLGLTMSYPHSKGCNGVDLASIAITPHCLGMKPRSRVPWVMTFSS